MKKIISIKKKTIKRKKTFDLSFNHQNFINQSQKQIYSHYVKSDILFYPSIYEGFGIPPLEAMACNCPVLTSNLTAMPEICRDAVLYCDPYNEESIKQNIELIISNNKLRNDLILKGQERIKHYSWKKSSEKMIKIVENIKK